MKPIPGSFETSRGFKFGAGLGALVLTTAGAAWSLVALIFRPGSPVWQFVLVMIPALTLAALTIKRLAAVARLEAPRPTESERLESARQGRKMGVGFAAVFAIESVLVAGAAMALVRANRPLLIPVAVIAIVGAHFVPLARVFRIPTYLVTGGVLVALAGASLLISDESTRAFALSISSAVVVWAAAGSVLIAHVDASPPEKTV